MDHWLSLYTRLVALLEALSEGEVTLRPNSLGALRNLVESFCSEVYTASLGADPPSCRATNSLKHVPSVGRGRFIRQFSTHLNPIEEGSEDDALSIPDSLPDLVDSAGEEESRLPSVLVEKGVIPPGVVLCQDRVRPNRFWLLG